MRQHFTPSLPPSLPASPSLPQLSPREPLILDSVLSDHTFSKLETHLTGLLQVYTQVSTSIYLTHCVYLRMLVVSLSLSLSLSLVCKISSLHDTYGYKQ